jgi:hypothetical protein
MPRDDEPRDEQSERRERRRKAKRDAMRKHGSTTGEVYRNAVLKRLRATKRRRRP